MTSGPPGTRDPRCVRITRIGLSEFRNHRNLRLDIPEARFVALVGENGAGKTNILEALSFLSPGRGLRRASYDEVACETGTADWSVSADIRQGDGDIVRVGTGRLASTGDRSRQIRINGEPAKSSEDLLELLRVIWLTPAMDGLFTGSESDRRRFLDRMVLAIDPGHGKRVASFETAMRGRNRLLEQDRYDDAWMSAIETEMAPLAVSVAIARRHLIDRLSSEIDDLRADGRKAVFPTARLAIQGEIDDIVDRYASSVDAEDAYASRLAESRFRDRAAARTLVGPNRSALAVSHAEKGIAAAKCSTGEQKALLIGLVLAHARLVARIGDMAPVLLLDEIAAHLDSRRKSALFGLLDDLGGQVWMTGTEAAMFAGMPEPAVRFALSGGSVVDVD